MVSARAVAILLGLAACQGHGDARSGGAAGSDTTGKGVPGARDAAAGSAHPAAADEEPSGAEEPDDEPATLDEGKVLDDLDAVPAWQAVVDRARYLARRKQHGVVFGTVGPRILVPAPSAAGAPGAATAPPDGAPADAGLVPSPFVWLVDDTDGDGTLAIRVAPGAMATDVVPGQRVALGGAWTLDEAHRWYWKVDQITALPPRPRGEPADPPAPALPGHEVVAAPPPADATPISLARSGDVVTFQVVGPPPAMDGDGWPVADGRGKPAFALLSLPGERASYGAQDLRTPDERWRLHPGRTYWLRIGRIHTHGADKPATINARTPPRLVP